MSSVVVDAAVSGRMLAKGPGVVEVRDEAGNVIGHFLPADSPAGTVPGFAINGEWPSSAELARREQTGRRYTTEEVIERLRGLRDAG